MSSADARRCHDRNSSDRTRSSSCSNPPHVHQILESSAPAPRAAHACAVVRQVTTFASRRGQPSLHVRRQMRFGSPELLARAVRRADVGRLVGPHADDAMEATPPNGATGRNSPPRASGHDRPDARCTSSDAYLLMTNWDTSHETPSSPARTPFVSCRGLGRRVRVRALEVFQRRHAIVETFRTIAATTWKGTAAGRITPPVRAITAAPSRDSSSCTRTRPAMQHQLLQHVWRWRGTLPRTECGRRTLQHMACEQGDVAGALAQRWQHDLDDARADGPRSSRKTTITDHRLERLVRHGDHRAHLGALRAVQAHQLKFVVLRTRAAACSGSRARCRRSRRGR